MNQKSKNIQSIIEFLADESGPTAVEYAVMLALIVVACLGSVTLLSQNLGDSFEQSAAALDVMN